MNGVASAFGSKKSDREEPAYLQHASREYCRDKSRDGFDVAKSSEENVDALLCEADTSNWQPFYKALDPRRPDPLQTAALVMGCFASGDCVPQRLQGQGNLGDVAWYVEHVDRAAVERALGATKLRDGYRDACTEHGRPASYCVDGPVSRPLTEATVRLSLVMKDPMTAEGEWELIDSLPDVTNVKFEVRIAQRVAIDKETDLFRKYTSKRKRRRSGRASANVRRAAPRRSRG